MIEYYDIQNPPVIPKARRAEIVDRFFAEASPGECLFQFYWSRRFEFGFTEQLELLPNSREQTMADKYGED